MVRGLARHDLFDRSGAQVDRLLERASQIAVGEDARRRARRRRRWRSCPCPCARSREAPRDSERSRGTTGTASPLRMMSLTCVSRRRPSAPPGMRAREVLRAEATRLQQRDRQRVAQRQRGGRAGSGRQPQRAGFLGAPRRPGARRPRARAWSAGLPVMAISLAPRRLTSGTMASSSALSPELDSAIITSCAVIMPRSPWLASAGCRKNAGVPVLASVEAILCAMWPDLPIPLTTTRPLAGQDQFDRLREAARPAARTSAATAAASISSTRRALSSARCACPPAASLFIGAKYSANACGA